MVVVVVLPSIHPMMPSLDFTILLLLADALFCVRRHRQIAAHQMQSQTKKNDQSMNGQWQCPFVLNSLYAEQHSAEQIFFHFPFFVCAVDAFELVASRHLSSLTDFVVHDYASLSLAAECDAKVSIRRTTTNDKSLWLTKWRRKVRHKETNLFDQRQIDFGRSSFVWREMAKATEAEKRRERMKRKFNAEIFSDQWQANRIAYRKCSFTLTTAIYEDEDSQWLSHGLQWTQWTHPATAHREKVFGFYEWIICFETDYMIWFAFVDSTNFKMPNLNELICLRDDTPFKS